MSILSNFLLSSVYAINPNPDAITEYNQNKIDTSEKLTELVDNTRDNITETTNYAQAHEFGTDPEPLTAEELQRAQELAENLQKLRTAVTDATSEENYKQALSALNDFKENSTDFAYFSARRAEFLATEKRLRKRSDAAMNMPQKLSRNPSDETLEEYSQISQKHVLNSYKYANLAEKLNFLVEKDPLSQYEKTASGAVTSLADITPESPLGKMFQRIGFTWEGSDIIDAYINNEHIPLFKSHKDKSYQIYPDGDGFTFEKLKINGKTYFIHFDIKDTEVIKYTGYDTEDLKEQKRYKVNNTEPSLESNKD